MNTSILTPLQNEVFCFRCHCAGSAITLSGKDNFGRPGQLEFSSYGTTGASTTFYNFDGSTQHPNVTISNTGLMTVGHDLYPPSIVAGDVHTVQDQIYIKIFSC